MKKLLICKIMNKIFLAYFIVIFSTCNAYCGNLQFQYEKENSSKFKDFDKYKSYYVIQKDLENYKCNKKSMYGELMHLFDIADETNHRFLIKIKKNYDNCSKNLKCWSYIEIDDYDYSWLDDTSKNTILFNNMVFSHK